MSCAGDCMFLARRKGAESESYVCKDEGLGGSRTNTYIKLASLWGEWGNEGKAERLRLVSERKRTFDQLFRSLQNPRAAVNAVLGFSRWFGRVLGFRVAGPGARKQERAVSEGSLGAQKGW